MRHLLRKWVWLAGLAAVVLCGGCSRPPRITAGGATFIDPIMQRWAAEYRRSHRTEIDYVAKGSGYGITNVVARNVAFGCTDAPMNKKELEDAQLQPGDILHVPLTLGAIAVVYHLPDIERLTLSGEVLADIYLGRIRRWNEPPIAALNPDISLPDLPIVPVRRAESSGTTYIFTEYLSKRSTAFAEQVGASKSPKWAIAILGKEGNAGIAAHVKEVAGTIGYVELEYARKNGIAVARLVNAAGRAVTPETEAVTAAAEAALAAPQRSEPYSLHPLAFSGTDAPGERSYPIVGVSYAILYRRQPRETGAEIQRFLRWVLQEGQSYAAELGYAPLPASLVERGTALLDTIILE